MTKGIEIRFAKILDAPRIVQFLHDYWRSDHIFCTNPELMFWQHKSPTKPDEDITFVIADRMANDGTPEMIAILGFIPFRRFDNSVDWSELSLAIWKVRNDANSPGLGLLLLKTIQRKLNPKIICAIGISNIVKPIYTALGYRVGALSHYALFPECDSNLSKIALNTPSLAHKIVAGDPLTSLIPIVGESMPMGVSQAEIDTIARSQLPRKSWLYVLNRYVQHPWYQYEIRAIVNNGVLRALIIWRRVQALGSSILRVVDVIGDYNVLAGCGPNLRKEIRAADCEYMDMLLYGIPKNIISDAGFISPDDHMNLILPNYFEPFEQKNINVEVAYRINSAIDDSKVRLFRGDSDQDRPNQQQSVNNLRRTA
jgi:hypothetical protein